MTDESGSGSDKAFKDWKMQMWMGQKSYEQGQYTIAEQKFHKALKDLELAMICDERLAVTLNNLALSYCAQGKHRDAEPLYQKALSIDESSGSSSKLMLAEDFGNIAAHYRKQGLCDQAEPLYHVSSDLKARKNAAQMAKGAQLLRTFCS